MFGIGDLFSFIIPIGLWATVLAVATHYGAKSGVAASLVAILIAPHIVAAFYGGRRGGGKFDVIIFMCIFLSISGAALIFSLRELFMDWEEKRRMGKE